MKITLKVVEETLEEIRKFKDLRKFQSERTTEFCKKYNIKPAQLNSLISIVAAERVKRQSQSKGSEFHRKAISRITDKERKQTVNAIKTSGSQEELMSKLDKLPVKHNETPAKLIERIKNVNSHCKILRAWTNKKQVVNFGDEYAIQVLAKLARHFGEKAVLISGWGLRINLENCIIVIALIGSTEKMQKELTRSFIQRSIGKQVINHYKADKKGKLTLEKTYGTKKRKANGKRK